MVKHSVVWKACIQCNITVLFLGFPDQVSAISIQHIPLEAIVQFPMSANKMILLLMWSASWSYSLCLYENKWSFTTQNVSVVICFYFCFQTFSHVFVCLFVLRFYGPVNPIGPCRARSVYLTTRLLGRFSPLSG